MPYAAPSDISALYGPDLLARLTDTDGNGVTEPGTVERALVYADAEINAFVGVRYALPLPSTPDLVKLIAIDIAVYRLASDHLRLTDEIIRRYENAVRQLKDIGAGKAVLPITAATGGAVAAPPDMTIIVDAPPRIFDRDTLRRL